jgi:hypothetical protein
MNGMDLNLVKKLVYIYAKVWYNITINKLWRHYERKPKSPARMCRTTN